MIVSLLIIAFSLVLLVYWFRYSCILLVRDAQEAAASNPAVDARFGFAQVQREIDTALELDTLHRSLDRDFALLKYLVEHAAGLRFESVEDRLLMLDYRVMRFWYRLVRLVAPQRARRALEEMASVLAILVRHMSERAGVTAEA